MKNINKYLLASPAKALLVFSIPTSLLTVALMINAVADQYFLAKFGDDNLMLGVAAVLPLMMTLQAVLGGGASNIVNTLAGKYTASDDAKMVKKSLVHGGLILATLNLFFVGLYLLFHNQIYGLLKLNEMVRQSAHNYASIVIVFSLIANASTLLAAYMRGRVFPLASLITLIMGMAGNLLICWFGFRYVKNPQVVMAGPVLSSAITLLASFLFLGRHDAAFTLSWHPFNWYSGLKNQFDLKMLKEMGLQIILTSMLPLFFTLPQFFYAGVLADGSAALSGFYLIFCRALNIVSLLGFGIAIAGLTLTSYYRGRGQEYKIAGLVRWGSGFILLLVVGFVVKINQNPRFFHELMLEGNNPLSAAILLQADRLMPVLQWMIPLNAVGLYYSFFYIALERPKVPVILSGLTTLFVIPVFLYIAIAAKLDYIWIAYGLVGLYICMVGLELVLLPIWHLQSSSTRLKDLQLNENNLDSEFSLSS